MTEFDEVHKAVRNRTGFWGERGAGCIPVCRSTGRILLAKRSWLVSEGGTWGVWGGAIDPGDTEESAARSELFQETGYHHDAGLVDLCLFEDRISGFTYRTFAAPVDDEFTAVLNWESEDCGWFALDDLPSPAHFGLEHVISVAGDTLRELAACRPGTMSLSASLA